MRKRLIHIGIPSAILLAVSVAVGLIGQDTTNMGRTYTGSQNVRYANEGGTGTTLHKLAKLTGAPSTAIITATVDTSGIVGIVVAGAGAAGSADIAFSGKASCVFDSATTAGHYVQNDTSTAGDCMDAGASYPTSGQVIGVVTSTNGGAGTYEVDLTLRQPQAGGGGGSSITYGAYAALPGACAVGDLYRTSDSVYEFQCTALNTWTPFFQGQKVTLPPAAGTWTQVNFGTSSITDSNGTLLFRPQCGTDTYRILALAEPGRPYTRTILMSIVEDGSKNDAFGIGWRESVTGKLSFIRAQGSSTVAGIYLWQYFSAPNTYGGTTWFQQTSGLSRYLRLRIASDNTNLSVWLSPNGVDWIQAAADVARSTAFTTAPDQVAIMGNCTSANSDTGAAVTVASIISWE